MRALVLMFLFLVSVSTFAQLRVAELTDNDIAEILLTDVYPIFTGDDGIECEAAIEGLEVLSRTDDQVSVRYRGRRDITQHGCAPEVVSCTTTISFSARGAWTTQFNCD